MAQESKLWQEINALGYAKTRDRYDIGHSDAIKAALEIVEAHEMTEFDQIKSAVSALEAKAARPCSCHPDDNPPHPCAQKYALSECRATRTPTAFNWTPEMEAIWPVEYRPTMSGLLAIWEAMQGAAVYGANSGAPRASELVADYAKDGLSPFNFPKPLADDGWIEWWPWYKLPSDSLELEVKCKDGYKSTGHVYDWQKPRNDTDWWHWEHGKQIAFYRVVS